MTDTSPAAAPLPPNHWDRRGWLYVLAALLLARAFVLYVALNTPLHPGAPGKPTWWSAVPLMRWDAGHYHQTMKVGYPDHITDQVAFFPGQSIAAWPIWQLTRQFLPAEYASDFAVVATTHLFGILGVLCFYAWARRCAGSAVALSAAILLLCYPPAFFLSTGYAEGVFLFCVAGVLLCLQRNRFGWAAAICAFATLTRPSGLALAVMTVVAYLFRSPPGGGSGLGERLRALRPRILPAALLGAVAVSGLIAFQTYLIVKYQRFDAYGSTNAFWATKPPPNPIGKLLTLRPILGPAARPLGVISHGVRAGLQEAGGLAAAGREWAELAEPMTWNGAFNLAFVIVMLIGIAGAGQSRLRRTLADEGAGRALDSSENTSPPIPRIVFLFPLLQFLMAYLADPVSGARLVGIARYHLVALPCFLLLAAWLTCAGRRAWLLALICVPLLLLQIVYIREFCDWILVS